MSDTKVQTGSSISFTGLLTILFIGLKLTHYIDWSWWWVLSPLWISFLVFIAIVVFAIGLGILVKLFE